MIKRAPSRNQRSKGIKVKRVLQICLLLGVCFWLIYQVKHSHDKKKEFDDKDAKVSVKARSDDEILKLGRKDLPQVQELAKNEKHNEEEEDAVEEEENKPEEEKEVRKPEEEDQEEANKHEEVDHEDEDQEEANTHVEQEEEGSKHEEEEQEEETKNEGTEERRGSGDEEMDEQDQERTEGEVDRDNEFIDEEKEREGEVDDRENEINEGEEKDGQVENENLLDDNDHDVGDGNTHVAREEQYKGDDASSAVSHDNQIIISETEKASSETSNENSESNILEDENKTNSTEEINGNQKNTGLKLGEGEMAESGGTLNVTTTEEKDRGIRSYNPEDSSLSTATNISTEADTEIGNSTGLSTEINGSSLQNGNETKWDSNLTQNATLVGATNLEATNLRTESEQANNSITISDGNQSDPNSTISTKTANADAATGYSFNNSVSILEKTISLNATADGEVGSWSSTKETANTTQNETLNSDHESGETNESSDSSSTEGTANGNSDNESGATNESLDSSSTNEIVDAAKEDLVDSSDSTFVQDGKESQIDLETLPDIRNFVDNSEDAAAE